MTTPLSQLSPSERAKRVAQLVKNPKTRAAVPDQYLPAAYKAQRATNARLDSEAAPGLTYRDVAHQRQAATTLQFGPDAVGRQQQVTKDMQGFWQQYADELGKGETDIKGIGDKANSQIAALAAAAPTNDTTGQSAQNQTDAANAAAVRKAILANIGAVQSGDAGAENTYASKMAHTVAPAQKLQAAAQGQRDTQDLRDKIAAFGTKFDADTIAGAGAAANEAAKTDLAYKSLGLESTKANTSAKQASAKAAEDKRHHKADEKNAANDPSKKKTQAELDYFNKHGYWPQTGPTKPKAGKGPDWEPSSGQQTAQTDFGRAVSYAKDLKKNNSSRVDAAAALTTTASSTSQPVWKYSRDDKGKLVREPVLVKDANGNTVQKTSDSGGWDKVSSAVASVALDLAYDGHVSPTTIKKLIAAGIKPSSLGVKAGVVRPAKLSSSQRAPGGT